MTLQEMRQKKGLTQEQASKILDISSDYLSMLENKIRNPSDKLKKKMAKLYGVSVAEIFLAIELTKR
ncbi:MAG: helix-turn-helix transcriptional regulator [Clostridia bacterium]|nr:helix-turn-helix transcriptional regulator [Clostridia bacterium]